MVQLAKSNEDIKQELTGFVLENNLTRYGIETVNSVLESLKRIESFKEDYPAIEADILYVNDFLTMGDDTAKRVCNLGEYHKGLLFGFTEKTFNDADWLEIKFPLVEEITYTVSKEVFYNKIYLAQGPNGKWTYSTIYSFGRVGTGGSTPSVYGRIFDDKNVCKEEAIKELLNTHQGRFESFKTYPDEINNDITFIRKTILALQKELKALTVDKIQMALF